MLSMNGRLLQGRPSAGGSAGQDQSVALDGKSDLGGFDGALVFPVDGRVQQVGENCRLKACRVGIDQHKERIVGEKAARVHQEGIDAVLYFPDFAFGSSPVGRRIHYDGVICVASAQFALHEFAAVVDEPADRSIRKSRNSCIFFGPCDHPLGGVDMGDTCTRLSGRDRRASRISEEIEDLHFSAGGDGIFNNAAEPVPVDGLLGEESRVFEVEGFETEGEVLVPDRPFLREIEKLPLAAALAAAVVVRVGILPFPAARCLPDDLRVRTDELIAAPDLEFLPVGSIQYLIVFP